MSPLCNSFGARRIICALTLLLSTLATWAEESVCSKVKIEIPQELTLERQGFEATMRITNGSPDPLNAVKIEVLFKDAEGNPVLASSDPNAVNAKFFIRESAKEQIAAVDGTGSVASGSTAVIKWLIIPAPGAAGNLPGGRLYKVGAKLEYTLKGEAQAVDVIPDSITVNPMPDLTLDYFLPLDVLGDEPFTAEIEAPVPFSLGVRVKNIGFGDASHLKIESAQPKIIENRQGLQVNFRLLGSQVQDKSVNDGLLLDFGTIGGKSAACGRWVMESSLSGKMTEFTATFTHDDALGGKLTSLIQAVRTHTLLRDVRLDSPGKDSVREFLAKDVDAIRLYDSDGSEAEVIDISSQVSFDGSHLQVPAVPGIFYASIPVSDSLGAMLVSQVRRADGRVPPQENVWISKVRNPQNGSYQSFLNIFDYPVSDPVTGEVQAQAQTYDLSFAAPVSDTPVLSVPGTQVVAPNQRVTFTVAASAPNGAATVLSATPLYAGATFQNGAFDWTPPRSGSFPITFSATANGKTVSKSVLIVAAVNEVAVAFAGSSAEVVENTGKAEIEITLDQPCSETVSVQVNAAPGSSAQVVSDYLPLGTLSFAPGEIRKKLVIELNDDLEAEATEVLKLQFGDITHGHPAVADAIFDLTLKDDDLVGALALVQGDQVIKVNPATGATISVLARDLYLRAPTGFVWNKDGDLLVASSSGRILAFDRAGKAHDELHPAVSLGQTGKLQIDAQGCLWTLSRFDETCRLFCLNASSGEVLRSLDLPLACTDFQVREDGQVAVLSPDTLTLVGATANVNISLPAEIHPSLLALDGNGDLLLAGGGAIHRYHDAAFSLVQEDATLDQPLAFTWQQGKSFTSTAQFITSYDGSSAAAVVQLGNSPQLALAGIKPAFITDDLAVVAEEGDVIHLRARAEGSPAVSHEWRLNDSPAAQGTQLDLTLEAAQDGARLVCVAKNALGEARSQSTLKVYKHLLAAADAFDAQEDQEFTGNVLSNDEARDAKAVLNDQASHGTVDLRDDGSFTWHPEANYHGPATFSYHLERLGRSSALATVTLTIIPVDDAPVLSQALLARQLLEDAAVNGFDLAAYFNDPDGDTLSFEIVSNDHPEILNASASGSTLNFQPKPDAFGQALVRLRASANGQSVEQDLDFTISPVNDAPVLAQSLPVQELLEDAAAAQIDLANYFKDVDGDSLSYQLLGNDHPEHLETSLAGSILSFRPKADANGQATLSLRVSDGSLNVEVPLTFNISPVDDAPVAAAIPALTVLEDSALATLDLTPYFSDVDGDTLTFELVTGASLLNAAVTGNTLHYQPKPDANGSAILKVRASANGKSADADVVINITPVDDAPVMVQALPAQTVLEDAAPSTLNLVPFFADVDGDSLSFELTGNDHPEILTASVVGAILHFQPQPDAHGTVTLKVRANANGKSVEADLVVTVTPVDDAPVALALPAQTVLEDSAPSTLDLTPFFSDIDGDSLSFALVSLDHPETVSANVVGSILHYQPKPDANGVVTLKLRATANGQSVDADLSLTVTPVDDAPVVAQAFPARTLLEDASAVALDLTPHFKDIDGDILTYEVVSVTAPELLSTSVAGSTLSFQPKPDANGSTIVKLRASANGKSVEADLVVTVTPVDDAPVASAIPAQTMLEDAAVATLDLSLYFKDVDADTLSYELVSGDALLTSTLSSSTLNFQPKADLNGTATLTLRATANGKSVDAIVTVLITPVDDAPTVARTPVIPELRARGTVRVVNIAGIFTDKDNEVSLITTAVNGNTHPEFATAVLANATDLLITPLAEGQTVVTLRGTSGGLTCDLPLTLNVLPSLQAQPQPDTAQVDKGGTVDIDILANDGPGLALSDVVITKLRNGEVSIDTSRGILSFHHNPIQDGATGFAYALKDPSTGILSASVWVDVTVIDNDHFPIKQQMPKDWYKPDGAKHFWQVDHKTLAFESDLSLCSKTTKDKETSAMAFNGRFENGSISFAAKISSKPGDRLVFAIDGVEKQNWTGVVDWVQVSVPVSAGIHTLTWSYVKDASGKAGEDRAWIDAVKLPLWQEPFPGPQGMPEAWEIPEGMKAFKLTDNDAAEGSSSLVSPNIGHNKTVGMRLTADFAAGDVGFLSKVSSQLNADFLEFWVDDTKVLNLSGEQDWTQKFATLTAGRHALTWIYRKDARDSRGKDSAWIDGLTLPGCELRIFKANAEIEGEGTVDPRLWIATDGQRLNFSFKAAPGWKLAEARLDDGTRLKISDDDDDHDHDDDEHDDGDDDDCRNDLEVELPALRRDTIVRFKFVKVKK
ncbi:MAG: hypothetical protein RL095_312 [Verrucomicrobiota bacterium]|jgi:hypothetical protein